MLLKTVTTHVHRLTVKIVHEICVKSNGQILQKSGKLLHTSFARIGTKEKKQQSDHCNQAVRSIRFGSSGLRGSAPVVWLSSALELYPLGDGLCDDSPAEPDGESCCCVCCCKSHAAAKCCSAVSCDSPCIAIASNAKLI